jgi:hypothetical protein
MSDQSSHAILHVGLHKTGTTFLQMCTKRSLAGNDRLRRRVFFSSQHSVCEDWKSIRKGAFARIRRAISTSMSNQKDHEDLMAELSRSRLLGRELLELEAHLGRGTKIFFHSDENTIGPPFGHSFQSPVLDYPFYPGAEMIIGLLADTAARLYDKVTVVITFRDFGDYVESSLKDAVVNNRYATGGRNAIPLPRLDILKSSVGVIGPRMCQIVGYVGNIPCLDHLRLVDYDILRRNPAEYLLQVSGNVFDQIDRPHVVAEKVNPSISNAEAIEAYLQDQPELRESLSGPNSGAGLLSSAERLSLTRDYIRFAEWAANEQKSNPRLSVFR